MGSKLPHLRLLLSSVVVLPLTLLRVLLAIAAIAVGGSQSLPQPLNPRQLMLAVRCLRTLPSPQSARTPSGVAHFSVD